MRLGEAPNRFILKRCRYSSLDKFEDVFENKGIGCDIFGRFSNLDKCQPEAVGDVISGTALDYVGTDIPASFGDYRLNSGRIIRLFVRQNPFAHFCAVFNNILQSTRNS